MGRYVEGEDRRQSFLLPQSLDDYVVEDNPVRVIEVFIDELDLGGLGFAGVHPAATGRPAYHPSTLLKIYLYGYLNRLQSRQGPSRFQLSPCFIWWSHAGSNRGPLQCHCSALPAEL